MLFGIISTNRSNEADSGGRSPLRFFRSRSFDLGMFGMLVLIITLTPLFLSIAILFLWLRSQQLSWPPPGSPPLPLGLWVSTGILVVISGTMFLLSRALRRERLLQVRVLAQFGAVLGVGFLLSQIMNWWHLYHFGVPDLGRQYVGLIGFFVVIHSLHVVGGVAALLYIAILALRGRLLPRLASPVRCTALYWHFIDLVWAAMLCLVLIPG